MATTKFTLIQSEKGGLRVWKDSSGSWLVCDRSGEVPESTEDGPLYLDGSRKAAWDSCPRSGRFLVIPVKSRSRSRPRAWTIAGESLGEWLIESGRVVVND